MHSFPFEGPKKTARVGLARFGCCPCRGGKIVQSEHEPASELITWHSSICTITLFSPCSTAQPVSRIWSIALLSGIPAVAITDHGYMYGVPDLALACDAVNHNTPEVQNVESR